MAQKRMFDKSILETDNFLNISLTAKALYFLLGMEADDEGFISPKRVIRLYGGELGDLKNLIDTGLIIPFKSGVIVITDWNQNNWLDNRRIRPTQYQEEKKMLILTEQRKYLLSNCLADAKQPLSQKRREEKRREQKRTEEKRREESSKEESPLEEKPSVHGIPNDIPNDIPGSHRLGKVRLGKVREEKVVGSADNLLLRDLTKYYCDLVLSLKGYSPKIGVADIATLKSFLKESTEAEVKQIFDWFMGTEKFKEHQSLRVALSVDSINNYRKHQAAQSW